MLAEREWLSYVKGKSGSGYCNVTPNLRRLAHSLYGKIALSVQ